MGGLHCCTCHTKVSSCGELIPPFYTRTAIVPTVSYSHILVLLSSVLISYVPGKTLTSSCSILSLRIARKYQCLFGSGISRQLQATSLSQGKKCQDYLETYQVPGIRDISTCTGIVRTSYEVDLTYSAAVHSRTGILQIARRCVLVFLGFLPNW